MGAVVCTESDAYRRRSIVGCFAVSCSECDAWQLSRSLPFYYKSPLQLTFLRHDSTWSLMKRSMTNCCASSAKREQAAILWQYIIRFHKLEGIMQAILVPLEPSCDPYAWTADQCSTRFSIPSFSKRWCFRRHLHSAHMKGHCGKCFRARQILAKASNSWRTAPKANLRRIAVQVWFRE